MTRQQKNRKGAAAILILILMVPLLGLLAFSIDYGYLLYSKTDLQRVADQAAIASTRDLLPDAFGNQDIDEARDRVSEYVKLNLGSEFVVEANDIKVGRYNPAKIYSSVEILDTGTFDTVQVTIRRDSTFSNNSISLYFARFLGNDEADISATSTAVLQKARFIGPGTGVFPFALEEKTWNKVDQGEEVSIYGDGRIEDEFGKSIPGNWGTLDIGPRSNSTSALGTQIEDGLSQSDLDSLQSQGVIPTADFIDGTATLSLNADTGLSSGLRHSIAAVHGTTKIAPIYKGTSGKGGNNLNFEVQGWAAVDVIDSNFRGSRNTSITVRKSFIYDASLLPQTDLSNISDVIEGAFTSPVLVQ